MLKGSVSKLLEMVNSQWIFRCISKHHHTKGTLLLATKEEFLKEIERQLDMAIDSIADDNWWIVEVGVSQLRDTSVAKQQY